MSMPINLCTMPITRVEFNDVDLEFHNLNALYFNHRGGDPEKDEFVAFGEQCEENNEYKYMAKTYKLLFRNEKDLTQKRHFCEKAINAYEKYKPYKRTSLEIAELSDHQIDFSDNAIKFYELQSLFLKFKGDSFKKEELVAFGEQCEENNEYKYMAKTYKLLFRNEKDLTQKRAFCEKAIEAYKEYKSYKEGLWMSELEKLPEK